MIGVGVPGHTALAGIRSFDRLQPGSYRAGKIAELYSLRGFDASHLASAAQLREEFVDLQFLAFNARFVAAARGSLVPVYERA